MSVILLPPKGDSSQEPLTLMSFLQSTFRACVRACVTGTVNKYSSLKAGRCKNTRTPPHSLQPNQHTIRATQETGKAKVLLYQMIPVSALMAHF